MVKRDISQLAVYEISEAMETLPLECLRSLYLEKTSEIIYVTKEKKLYGIICMGEVLYGHKQNKVVKINRSFTSLKGFNFIKARDVFAKKRKVNKIPIVNEQEELLGDYSRWDDMLFVERNQEQIMERDSVKKLLGTYENVYIVPPVETENSNYLRLIEYLNSFCIDYKVLSKGLIGDKMSEKAICILLDEDEKVGVQCLYGIEPCFYDIYGNDIREYDILYSKQYQIELTTYKNLLIRVMMEARLESLEIRKSVDLKSDKLGSWYGIGLNERATVLFSLLEKTGVKCFCIQSLEGEKTEYAERFEKGIQRRLGGYGQSNREWLEIVDKEAFYGELYQQVEYEQGEAQKEIAYYSNVFQYKRNISRQYFNAKDGKRITCYQPKEYIGTIYLLGVCFIVGPYVEDQYTVASYLQKKLLERGYPYRVENYGSMLHEDGGIDTRLEEIGSFQPNDIIIYHSIRIVEAGIKCDTVEKIFEKNNISSAWVVDGYSHCNHKVYNIVADNLLTTIEPYLSDELKSNNYGKALQINFHKVMEDYIQRKYLYQFPSFLSYNTVGAIIMRCNIFHKGHQYLIKRAKEKVEFLIVFVINDKDNIFSLEERIKMIEEGTRDINHIMIIPSGDFICSKLNFPEYYMQEHFIPTSLELNAEYDINMFADYIARPLHVTHRFVGALQTGKAKKIYNEAAKRILPQKGISFVEIPKMKINEKIVSTQEIQDYLENEQYEQAFSLLPATTIQYLKKQL